MIKYYGNAAGILIKAGDILNDLIHEEIRKISDEGLSDPTYLNINKEIGEVDPLLWTFIESITRTVRQRRGS